jgi:gamma-glutamylcyclotransferase (GGCT)/AIG2-like uncharacterized protein YtfP|tara:strand:- start:15004 stop:15405 length:402 start_codon:yes stop_codon:yes gene_type:complete
MSNFNTYQEKSISQLRATAVRHFHKYIRLRDQDQACISCGKYKTLQAGHFYSGGHYPELRFDEDNVHGQCSRCNLYLSANLIPYADSLRDKIGIKRYERLKLIVSLSKRNPFKWNRFFLIDVIEKYKKLNKTL